MPDAQPVEFSFAASEVRRSVRVFAGVFAALLLPLFLFGAMRSGQPMAPTLVLTAGIVGSIVFAAYLNRGFVRVDPIAGVIECRYRPAGVYVRPLALPWAGERAQHPLLGLSGVSVERAPGHAPLYRVVLEYGPTSIPLAPRYWYGEPEMERVASEIRRAALGG